MGPTTCIDGWMCVYQNDWYSQCLQASSTGTTALTTSTMTSASSEQLTTIKEAVKNIHLCGDSKMASYDSGSLIKGWGTCLPYSFFETEYVVSNHAIGGRSARSYTHENRFYEVSTQVQQGD